MKKLKIAKSNLAIAYFGTPHFSARFLEKLLTDISIKHLIEIKLVVTQPDKPVGRKQILTKSPVKIVAEKYDIKVIDKNDNNWKSEIRNLDIAFLYAYGEFIPKNVLNLPKYGFLNTHPSLLPKYRGASPVAYPLILGDKKTGVTLIQLDEKIDHGPIIAQKELKIETKDRRSDLEVKLTDLAFKMFKRIIRHSGLLAHRSLGEVGSRIDSGVSASWRIPRMTITSQNHTQATFTRLLTKNDGFIPLSNLKKALKNEPLSINEISKIIKDYCQKNNLTLNQKKFGSGQAIYNLFRGLFPWPGLWTLVNIKDQPHFAKTSRGKQKRLKITNLDYSNGKLTIRKVQLEGKKEVDFETFNQAYSIF